MTIEEYVSVRATPELVGRKEILLDIHEAIKEKSKVPHVFYITAPGGWGKTRLVDAVLKKLNAKEAGDWASPNLLSASRLVDLYHTYTHSEEGLIADIVEVLDENANRFTNYVQQHAELDRIKYDFSEMFPAVGQQRILMKDAFIQDFNSLGTTHQKIILALDTVENLMYETDRVQEALGLADEPIGVAGWLVKGFLPKIRNAVVLISGRPETPQLKFELETLRKNGEIKFTYIELGTFSEAETLVYFNMVLELAREDNPQVADRLEKIPQETRQVVHYLSGGQPFLLSLFVDYVAVAEELLPKIRTSLDDIKRQVESEMGLEREQEEFKDAILQGFQKIRRPLDEVIRALAWTQKGMGADLLAWIMKRDRPTENEIEQAKDHIKTLRDPNLRLSFVKIRDIDNIVFLQDEMYNLMRSLHQRGRLQHNVKQTYELITRFYGEKIKNQAKLVEDLQKSTSTLVSSGSLREFTVSEKGKLFEEQQNLRVARARLQSYQVEYVYYNLQVDYTIGLQAYSELAEGAFQSNDTNLWLLLRDELLKFAKPLREHKHELEALNYIDSDIGIRSIKSNIASGHYDRAQWQIEQFRNKCPDLLVEGSFADLNLKIWECWSLIHSGKEYGRAKDILLSVLKRTENFSDSFNPTFDAWRHSLLTAYAQDIIGYLYRSEGNYIKAVENYRKNLPFWREHRMETEHANALNNISWSLAELGEFETALTYCEDGLNLRRKLGYRYLVALSLNTLGLIETRNRQPERGRFRCEQALGIFRDLEQPRGIGLTSHALAEALRRMTSISDLLTDEQSNKNLELAEEYAKEAIQIFTNIVKEPMRLVEAYIELGCVYREMARRKKQDDFNRSEIISKGEEAFTLAEKYAGNTFAYRGYDSLVNLAWMYYYVDNFKSARKTINYILQAIDNRYLFTEGRAPIKTDEPIRWFWVQLGKSYLLLGKIAFDEYAEANKHSNDDEAKEKLMAAGSAWVLSIAYNEKYKEEFRDLVEGRKGIYKCLGSLNSKEIELVREGIHKVYDEFPGVLELKSFEIWVNEKFGFIS